ncbi:MAG: 50S ribosomal protein L9 [Clostridia bacterium]
MKIVLLQDIKGLGKKLQVIEASEGYARNYLIPRKMAKLADNKSVSEAKSKVESEKYKKEQEIKKANEVKSILEKETLEFKIKVGKEGRLFGSITDKEIAERIKETHQIKIDKKKVTVKVPIKSLGVYTAEAKLYEGIVANVKISVIEAK